MKKLTMLIMAALFAMYGVAQTTYTVPFTEDFEDPNVGSDWTLVPVADGNRWMIGSAVGHPGKSLYITNNGSSSGYTNTITSYASAYIKVDFGDFPEYVLSFDRAIQGQTATTDRVEIFIIPEEMSVPLTWTGGSDNWITGTGVQYLGALFGQSTWQQSEFVIPGYTVANTTKKVVFMFYCNATTGSGPIAIDNISIGINACATPANVTALNENLTTAEISWTGIGNETEWSVVVSTTAVTNFNTVTPVVTTNNPYTAAGLTSNTQYYAYVKANCDTDGASLWSSAVTFRTTCEAVSVLPWTEDFEGYSQYAAPSCWIQTQPYTSTYLYPCVQTDYKHAGTKALKFYGNATQMITSPEFTADVKTLEVDFWLYKVAARSGIFEVGVASDPTDPNSFVAALDVTSTTVASWFYIEVPLNNVPAGKHYISFRQRGTDPYAYHIDDLTVRLLDDCIKPYAVKASDVDQTSANINWASGSGTTYNIIVSTTAITNFVGVSSTPTTNNPYNLTGLTPDTQYFVYVQADCGASQSGWSNAATFKTLCTAIPTLDLIDNFDSYAANTAPTCWIHVESYLFGGRLYPLVTTTQKRSGANGLHFYGSYITQTIATPMFAQDVNNSEVSFWLYKNSTNAGTFEVGVMSDVLDPSSFLPVSEVGSAGTNSTWYYFEVPLNHAPLGNHFIAFRQKEAPGNYFYHLDDLDIHALPSCLKPVSVTASNVRQTSADIYWSTGGSEEEWNIIVSDVAITNFAGVASVPVASGEYYNATNLTPDTRYYVYLQSNCGTETSNWTSAVTFKTPCNVITLLPYTHNFDSNNIDGVPACWVQAQPYGIAPSIYPRATTTNHSAPNSLTFSSFPQTIITTPEFAAEANTLEVSFWLRKSSASSGTFEVGVISDPSNISTFGSIQNITLANYGIWYYFEVPLTSAGTDYHYIAFKHNNSVGATYYYYLDDVDVHGFSPCAKPTNVVVSNETTTSADINWGAGSSEAAWNVIVSRTAVTDFDNAASVAVTSPSYTATGLSHSTQYYVYVQADCDSVPSNWTKAVTFTTSCSTVIVTAAAPYIENAEASLVCWTQENLTGGISWITTAAQSNINPAPQGTRYILLVGTSNGPRTNLISPVLDLSALTSARLKYYHTQPVWSPDQDTLGVYYRTSETNPWILLQSFRTSIPTWVEETITLPNPSTAYQLCFRGFVNWGYGIGLDNIVIDEGGCAAPAGFTTSNVTNNSAEITWDAGTQATSWNVIVSDVALTEFGSIVPNTVSSGSYSAAGLNSDTQYYVYVQSDCGTDGTSNWIQAITFKTLCDPVTLPWTDNFDSYPVNTAPTCWIRVDSYTASGNVYPRVASTQKYSNPNSLLFYGHVTETITTPIFATEVNTAEVSFRLYKSSASSGTFEVGVMSDVGNPSTFAPIQNVALTSVGAWYYVEVPLAAASNGNRFIAFRQSGTTTTDAYYLDDVDVHVLPSCPKPTGVKASNVTGIAANITWGAGISATAWNVIISDTVVTNFANATSIPVTSTSYSATGLAPSTQYYVYVQTDCGGSTSNWTSVVTFQTLCVTITALPLTDNFNSYASTTVPTCWTQSRAYNGFPRISDQSSHSPSGSIMFGGGGVQIIGTPELAADANTLEVSFWLRNQSVLYSGTFEVGVMSDVLEPNTFYPILDVTPTVETWIYVEVPLTDAPAGNHFIAFRQSDVSYAWYYYLDDIDVHLVPTCFRPTSVEVSNITQTSVDIDWTTGISSETAWNVVVSPTPITNFNTVVPVAVTSPSYTALGLTHSTLYYVYVQADCGVSDGASTWTQPITFKTACGAITASPWSENFDSYVSGDVPYCWTQVRAYTSGAAVYPRVTGTPRYSNPNSIEFHGYGTEIIATPEFAVEAYTISVSFQLRMENLANSGTFEVGVMSNVSDPNTFETILNVTPTTANTWLPITVSLANAPTGYHYVAFKQDNTTASAPNYNYWIDDVAIVSTPSVPPTVLTGSVDNITTTGATLHKTVTAGSRPVVSEGVKYREVGATYWSSTTTAVAATAASIGGLTPATVHEYFAYAIVEGEQFSGDTLTFATLAIPPTVTTLDAAPFDQTTATLNKTVISGSESITVEGFGYSVSGSNTWINAPSNGDITGLTANTAYDFYAFATTATDTYYGDTLSFTTLAHVPPTVQTVAADVTSTTTATLNKNVTPGTETITAEGWKYKKVSDTNWIDVINGNLTGLNASTAYEFHAYAIAGGTTFSGDTLTFTTPDDGVGYYTANTNEFIIYPNPTNSMATIKVEGLNTSAKVTVTDINGKLIETRTISAGNDTTEFDVANYSEGTYLVRVVADGINRVEKLIVRK